MDTYKDDYQHEVFDVQTEDEKHMKKIELDLKKQKERERLEQLEIEKLEKEESLDKPDEEGEENNEDEEDEIEYEVYYDGKEIKNALMSQRDNIFKDVIKVQQANQKEFLGIAGLQQMNKFIISEWAPKERNIEEPKKKKAG